MIMMTTQIGYTNRRKQVVVKATGLPGNDFNQKLYVLHCLVCANEYRANGSDIFERCCPDCQGGRPGI